MQVPGFRLPSSLRVDAMHVWDLGNTLRFHGLALRRLLDAGYWPGGSHDERVASMVQSICAY